MIRYLLTPEDFEGKPYLAALNQIGHMVLGGALMWALGVYAAALVVAIVELWQYYRLNATRADCYQDTAFWCIGMVAVTQSWFAVAAAICGAVWMVTIWYLSE